MLAYPVRAGHPHYLPRVHELRQLRSAEVLKINPLAILCEPTGTRTHDPLITKEREPRAQAPPKR